MYEDAGYYCAEKKAMSFDMKYHIILS